MRLRIVRRGGVLALTAVAALLAGVAPASAAPGDGSAFGLAVDVTLLHASAVHVGPLAQSRTSGPMSATVASATVPGVVTVGLINSAATRDQDTGAVTATASTADVDVPLLAALGRVGAKLIAAKCVATQSGEHGSATLTKATLGALGALDASPRPNTTIAVKVPGVGNVATLILDEQVHHRDGSLTVNAFHLHLLGGPYALGSGDVIISSATCGPAGLPIPMASGAGLWLGLGLLGAVGLPVGATVLRRRRTSAAAAV
ncbi:MAG TPA: choice-of-anchor P family protein [Pseudonocardiaceae bacterium]|nr:choice-of-anchor P family protein [Pseudonocardiaceae bacterium]